jgi:hypothetical protein
MKTKTRIGCRKALPGRLLAYSVMAGAALAFSPAVDAAVVYSNDLNIAGITSSNEVLIQSQQMQSQRVRHQLRHKDRGQLHALCSFSNGSGTGAGYTCSTATTTTTGGE